MSAGPITAYVMVAMDQVILLTYNNGAKRSLPIFGVKRHFFLSFSNLLLDLFIRHRSAWDWCYGTGLALPKKRSYPPPPRHILCFVLQPPLVAGVGSENTTYTGVGRSNMCIFNTGGGVRGFFTHLDATTRDVTRAAFIDLKCGCKRIEDERQCTERMLWK